MRDGKIDTSTELIGQGADQSSVIGGGARVRAGQLHSEPLENRIAVSRHVGRMAPAAHEAKTRAYTSPELSHAPLFDTIMKDFVRLTDLSTELIVTLLDRADQLFTLWHSRAMPQTLRHRKIALWFWGQGFRNRVAFEIGARSMGGDVTYLPGELGVHEPLEDIGAYLSNWFDLLVVRCRRHADLQELAARSSKPVINARTDFNHPCEILGDLQFIRRTRGTLDGLNVVFVGETTNVCRSWFEAAVRLPISVTQVAPVGYLASESEIAELNSSAKGTIVVSNDLSGALGPHVHLVYTDCWPANIESREAQDSFLSYQITKAHLERIHPDGLFLPCPPVSRGREISADAVDSPRYLNVNAKEFLLHAQNALMEFMLTEYGA